MRSQYALIVLAGWLLAACAAPTPYQPADGGFGYAVQQIEDDRYRVSFAGNADTPRETVQNYLLYRAAELTVQNGYDHFRIVDQSLERSTAYRGTIDDPFFFHDPRFGRHRTFFGPSTVTAHPIDRYTAFADVVLFEGDKPRDDLHAYDARDVLRRLEPTVIRPEAAS